MSFKFTFPAICNSSNFLLEQLPFEYLSSRNCHSSNLPYTIHRRHSFYVIFTECAALISAANTFAEIISHDVTMSTCTHVRVCIPYIHSGCFIKFFPLFSLS